MYFPRVQCFAPEFAGGTNPEFVCFFPEFEVPEFKVPEVEQCFGSLSGAVFGYSMLTRASRRASASGIGLLVCATEQVANSSEASCFDVPSPNSLDVHETAASHTSTANALVVSHTTAQQPQQPLPSWMADLQYRLSRRRDAAQTAAQPSIRKPRRNVRLQRLQRRHAQAIRDQKKRAGSEGGGGGGEGDADGLGDGSDGDGGAPLSLTWRPAVDSSSGIDTGSGCGNGSCSAVVLACGSAHQALESYSILCKDGVLGVSEEALAWLDARFPATVRAEMPREAFRLTLLSWGLRSRSPPRCSRSPERAGSEGGGNGVGGSGGSVGGGGGGGGGGVGDEGRDGGHAEGGGDDSDGGADVHGDDSDGGGGPCLSSQSSPDHRFARKCYKRTV